MGDYAHWDMRPYQEPPQPPERPTMWAWMTMSERARQEYEAGLSAYLVAVGDPHWWSMLCDMACFYQTWFHEAGRNDPNWKRGGA